MTDFSIKNNWLSSLRANIKNVYPPQEISFHFELPSRLLALSSRSKFVLLPVVIFFRLKSEVKSGSVPDEILSQMPTTKAIKENINHSRKLHHYQPPCLENLADHSEQEDSLQTL